MLRVHTISDLFDLPVEQQQAVQKSIRCKERLIDWIRARNLIPPKQVPVVEPHHEPCKCQKKNPDPKQWGWIWVTDERRDESDVHPSGVTDCLKSLWFSCSGYAQEHYRFVDPSLQMIFDMGHGWHYVMQNFYGKPGAWCDPACYHAETKIEPDAVKEDGSPLLPVAAEYWIKGHADALIDDYFIPNVPGIGEVSVRLIHEYKTINDAGYKKLNKPKVEHTWQATIYSAVFNAPFVVYLYTDKDNSQTVDYPVAFNGRLWEEITKKIKAVQSYVESGVMPPWDQTSQTLNPHECRGCGYAHICQPPR